MVYSAHSTVVELLRLHPMHTIPLLLVTNSHTLIDFISKGSKSSECLLMLYLAAACKEFKDLVLSDLGFIRSGTNHYDFLTNSMQAVKLHECFSGILYVNLEQWIILSNTTTEHLFSY